MEGDGTVPSNLICSASPHSELKPYLPSLSSIPRSCDQDGKGINRKRERIREKRPTPKQQSKDRMALKREKPTKVVSTTKRERDSGMVSKSLAVKLLRLNTTQREQIQKTGLNIDAISWCPSKQDTKYLGSEEVQFSCSSEECNPRSTGQDWDTSLVAVDKDQEFISEKASGSSPPTNEWVIGPLFQSLKSKMATFTEIVMSPARLFKPNSLPTLSNQLDFLSQWEQDGSNSEVKERVDLKAQMLNVNCNEDKKVSVSEDCCTSSADFSPKQKEVDELISHSVPLKLLKGKGRRKAIHKCSLAKQLYSSLHSLPNMPIVEEECVLAHLNSKENPESNFASSTLVVKPSDQPNRSNLNMIAKMEEQVARSTVQTGPSLSKYVSSRRTTKKHATKMFCDVSPSTSTVPQLSICLRKVDSKCNKEHHAKTPDMETKMNCIDEPRVSPSSSICHSQPDSLFLSENGTSFGGISVRKSTRKGARNVTVKDFLIKTQDLDNLCFQHLECDEKHEPVENAVCSASKGKRKLKYNSLSDVATELTRIKRVKGTVVAHDEILSGSENLKLKNAMCTTLNFNTKSLEATLNHTKQPISMSMSRKGKIRPQKGFVDIKESLSMPANSNVESIITMIMPSPDQSNVYCENHHGDMNDASNINDSCKKIQKKNSHCEVDNKVICDITPETSKVTSTVSTAEKVTSTLIGQELDLAGAGERSAGASTSSRYLLRSRSCPEIPFPHNGSPVSPSIPSALQVKIPVSNRRPSLHLVPSTQTLAKRVRRHTVSSVEVEREMAPLCLRKEVYPSRRPRPNGNNGDCLSPSVPLSPSVSLSTLAFHFLLSPVAFLSQKLERRAIAANINVSGHFASCSSPSALTSSSALLSCSSVWRPLAGPIQKPDTSPVSSLCKLHAALKGNLCFSVLSKMPLESERIQQSEEDGGDTSCHRHEFDYTGLREEIALSDSEIKMVCSKNEERGKVSTIRIRKTLPKPVNNLTPMGLPRPIRLKKKEFSLEEIYTNKNFIKPLEGRLETIFEVPLSCRNGSQSFIGKKRMKRFFEFPETGVVRKPRRPLGKAGITSAFGRTRRGGYNSSKDDSSYNVHELDTVLCSKLEQLESLIAFD